jgi:hypothetical protein
MIKKELMTKGIGMDKASGDEMKETKKTVRKKFLAARPHAERSKS